MNVGIDIDGVVADFTTACNAWVLETEGFDPGTWTEWDEYKKWPNGVQVWNRVWEEGVPKGLFLRCRPIAGAVDSVCYLRNRPDIQLVFITHRGEKWHEMTQEWLDKHGLSDIPLHCTKFKTEVPVDVMIDDKPETVEDFLDIGRRAILFRQPWNEHACEYLPYANNWKEVLMQLFWPAGFEYKVLKSAV